MWEDSEGVWGAVRVYGGWTVTMCVGGRLVKNANAF